MDTVNLNFGYGCYLLNSTDLPQLITFDVYNCTSNQIYFYGYSNDDCSNPINASYILEWDWGCVDVIIGSFRLKC